MLNPVLEKVNVHPHDEFIVFQEEGHKYTITNDVESKYTSVTTWNHGHFPKFDADSIIDKMMKGKNWKPGHKYWGMTKEDIKNQWNTNGQNVSSAGTDMHFNIECFMNNDIVSYPYTHTDLQKHYTETTITEGKKNSSIEWQYFLKFVDDHPELKPYRTEWLVYDKELKLSGAIDMVYENLDGSLMIYDWKRSKGISAVNNFNKFAEVECISHLPDSNYWHYSLQLNTYKRILERNYGKKVTNLRLVRIHPDCDENTYEIIDVPDLTNDIDALFELRRNQLMENTNGTEKIVKKNSKKTLKIITN